MMGRKRSLCETTRLARAKSSAGSPNFATRLLLLNQTIFGFPDTVIALARRAACPTTTRRKLRAGS